MQEQTKFILKEKVLPFMGGLWISGLFTALIAAGILFGGDFMMSCDLYPEQGDAETIKACAIMLVIILVAIAILITAKAKSAAIGAALPAVIWVIIISLVLPAYLDKTNYYEPFNKEKWLCSYDESFRMIRQLVKDQSLIGLSENDVYEKLGYGTPHYADVWVYQPEMWWSCGLWVQFNNDTVSKVDFYVPD